MSFVSDIPVVFNKNTQINSISGNITMNGNLVINQDLCSNKIFIDNILNVQNLNIYEKIVGLTERGVGIFRELNNIQYYDSNSIGIGTSDVSENYALTISGGLYLTGNSMFIHDTHDWLFDSSKNLYVENINTLGIGRNYFDLSLNNQLDISGNVYFRNNLIVDNELILNGINVYNKLNETIDSTTDLSVNHLDVSGTLNVKSINIYEKILDLSNNATPTEGSIVNVSYRNYDKFITSNTGGWNDIDNDLTTGYVVSLIPSSANSKLLIHCYMHISVDNNDDSRWWGARLYKKIGSGDWSEVTGATNNQTTDRPSGTGCFMASHHQSGQDTFIQNLSNSYVDDAYDNTSIHYYTIYWKCRIGADDANKTIHMNRADSSGDAFRSLPISSLVLKEIYYP
jgi:hypothetical protein